MRRAFLFVASAALGLVAACSAPAAPGPDDHPAEPSRDCEASWRETIDWAVALQREPSTSMGAAHMPLVAAEISPDLDVQQAVVDLWLSGAQVREGLNEPLTGAELSVGLERWMRTSLELARVGDPPSTITMGVEPDVKWGLVVDSVERIHSAGYAQIAWLFTRPGPVRKPAWWWRDLQAEGAMQRSYEASHSWSWRASLADQTAVLEQVLASCPELARLPRTSAADWLAALGASDAACRCQIDRRGLRSALWFAHPADASTARVVELAAPDAVGVTVIEATADTPWSEVAPRIAALPSRARVFVRVVRP